MPELPEVETTRRGIEPHINSQRIEQIIVRQSQLRWPVPDNLQKAVQQTISQVDRRGKYLLLHTGIGTIIIHLGMSGSLRIVDSTVKPEKHDHIDVVLNNRKILRYNDTRRFGAWLWTEENPLAHKLLTDLGPEPLIN